VADLPNSVYREPNVSRSVTIADGQTDSDVEDLEGETLVGAYLPASEEGTTLSFKAATAADGTFVPVHDTAGDLVEYTVASSRYVPLDPAVFSGIRFLKLVLGAQTGAATIGLATRRLG